MEIQDTSLEAWEYVQPIIPTIESRVLKSLALSGEATCEDIERDLKLRHQTASACLTKLKQKGVVEDSGNRGKTMSGRKAIKWRIADVGYAAGLTVRTSEQLRLALE
jgi:predicted ArsR family transcriptional regulator